MTDEETKDEDDGDEMAAKGEFEVEGSVADGIGINEVEIGRREDSTTGDETGIIETIFGFLDGRCRRVGRTKRADWTDGDWTDLSVVKPILEGDGGALTSSEHINARSSAN
jgi:hypothetical protein